MSQSVTMGLQLESGARKSPQKMVTITATPDYIPTIDTNVLIQNASVVGQTDKQSKQWGRVRKVIDIWAEHLNKETENVSSEKQVKKRYGVDDLRRTARIFMRSKRAAKRVRAKYSSSAMKVLQKRTASMLDVCEIGGPPVDASMFCDYSLTDMYHKLKQQKHIKLAVLQQKFLDELPVLREVSVKENLSRKIEALEKLKRSQYVLDAPQQPQQAVDNEDKDTELSKQPPLSRRQSRLRQSVDLSSNAMLGRPRLPTEDEDSKLPKVQLTVADVEREIAMSKSRERIEHDLHLPGDRIARFALLKANVDKINGKFKKMHRGKKTDGEKKRQGKSEEDKAYYVPSRFTKTGMVS